MVVSFFVWDKQVCVVRLKRSMKNISEIFREFSESNFDSKDMNWTDSSFGDESQLGSCQCLEKTCRARNKQLPEVGWPKITHKKMRSNGMMAWIDGTIVPSDDTKAQSSGRIAWIDGTIWYQAIVWWYQAMIRKHKEVVRWHESMAL